MRGVNTGHTTILLCIADFSDPQEFLGYTCILFVRFSTQLEHTLKYGRYFILVLFHGRVEIARMAAKAAPCASLLVEKRVHVRMCVMSARRLFVSLIELTSNGSIVSGVCMYREPFHSVCCCSCLVFLAPLLLRSLESFDVVSSPHFGACYGGGTGGIVLKQSLTFPVGFKQRKHAGFLLFGPIRKDVRAEWRLRVWPGLHALEARSAGGSEHKYIFFRWL